MLNLDFIVNQGDNYHLSIGKTCFVFSFMFLLISITAFSQKGKNQNIETVLECVKYIGNDTYVATYGYENPNNKDIVVAEDSSVVIYNNGQSKKNVVNTFKPGYTSKAFSQTFKSTDHCIWRVVLPNGNVKLTTANKSSSHCRIEDSDIDPLFDGAFEGGVLWPELYWLSEQENVESNDIFQIDNTNAGNETVLIEVVAFEGVDLSALRNEISVYGFTNEIPNGNNPLVITGFFPIQNLQIFNQEPLSLLVNFVRPVITPSLNAEWSYSGLVGTQQDLAMRSNLVRDAYNLDGTGTTICVISDSYGDPSAGIGSGDLPGTGEMQVLSDLSSIGPFSGTDEGRAMVELIYDIAPGADFKFWTGTASPGYMAYGITQFVTQGCDIGVDDVTHLTEPFLPVGQIAQAVEYAKDNNMHYVTSAGNFDNRGFRGNFTPTSIPSNFGDFSGSSEQAHDFGGGIMKGVSLLPGIYIIVLQWDDEFWAQGQTPGAQHDLNFWMVDDQGNFKYFGNRDNNGDEFDPTGEDPIEILGFNVLNPTTLNVMITGANIPPDLPFQYIVFKAPDNGWQFIDSGKSFNATTVVGHAASPYSNSVGAAFFGFTPEFENRPDMLEPFTSKGGLDLLGNQLNKPDYAAPDGGNNTFFGQVLSYDEDDFPNFFGTSAAAPAAAGGMALLLEASEKFYDLNEGPLKNEFTPSALKGLLQATALDIDAPGPDINSGDGLIQLDQTLLSLANPTPQILELLLEEGKTPGLEPFTLTLIMQYPVVDENGAPILGEGGTEIKFREEVLPLTDDNWDWAINGEDEYIINYYVDIGTFIGNPEITVTNPPKAEVADPIDGGSVSVNLLDIQKKDLLIKAGNATKLFGEVVPVEDFSYQIFEVDPTDPDPANWMPYVMSVEEQAALDAVIEFSAEFTDFDGNNQPVNFLTEVGKYPIKVKQPDPMPVGLTEIYNFIGFGDDNIGYGALTIDALPVTVVPDDQTLEYGEELNISLVYNFMTPNIADSAAVAQYIINSHNELLAPDFFAIANRGLALVDEGTTSLENRGLALVDRGLALVDRGLALVDGSSWMLTEGVIENRGLALVDGVNNVYDIGIDVAAEFILEDPTVVYNRGLALVDRGLALVDGQTLFEAGEVGVPFIDNRGLALVDRGLALVDRGLALVDEEGNPVDKDFKLFFVVSDEDEQVNEIKSVHFVTGLDVLPNGFNHYIAPGALLNPNLAVTNELGELHWIPRTIKIAVDETIPENLSKVYGTEDPVFTAPVIVEGALVPGDVFTGTFGRAAGETAGTYTINLGTLAAGNAEDPTDHPYFGMNYHMELVGQPEFEITKALLTVTANDQTKVYGEAVLPEDLSISYTGWVNGEEELDTSPVASTTVDATTNTGNYEDIITVSGGSDNNYTFTYVAGDFEVTKATLAAIANDQSKEYGDAVLPEELTIMYTGWVNGVEELDTPPVASTTVDATTNVGGYTDIITVSGGSDNNYTFTYVAGDFEVTKATLAAIANDQSKEYGDAVLPEELTIMYTGWVNGVEELDTPPVASTTVDATTDVGNYAGTITVSGGSDNNYTFSYVAGDFTITQATLTAAANDQTKVYGKAVLPEELSISYSGWVNGVEELDTPPVASTTVDATTDVGNYADVITVSGGSDNNYSFIYAAGDFTVTKATLTATADDQTKVYGEAVLPEDLSISYSGWVNGVEELDTSPTASTTVDPSTNVGNYPNVITVSGGSDNNYSFSYESGDFIVTKARLEVTILSPNYALKEGDPFPTNLAIEYGYCNPEYGLRNGDHLDLNASDIYSMPTYTGDPGLYTLILNDINATNYEVVQTACGDPGQFYVNPFGPATPNVHPRLDCIEESSRYPGLPYVAHLYYDNPNATTIFVPIGVNNRIHYASGTGNMEIEGGQPTLFYPGTHSFDVYFDGSKLIWELQSDNTLLKEAVSSDASVGSNRCSDSGARLSSNEVNRSSDLSFNIESLSGFPNPATNLFFVNLNVDLISKGKFNLVDMNGKIHDVRIKKNQTRGRLEVDTKTLKSGMYLLRLEIEDQHKIIKIIKQ